MWPASPGSYVPTVPRGPWTHTVFPFTSPLCPGGAPKWIPLILYGRSALQGPSSRCPAPSASCPPSLLPLAPVFPDCPPTISLPEAARTSSDHTLQTAHWNSQTSQGEHVRRRPQWWVWAPRPPHLCPLWSTKEARRVHSSCGKGGLLLKAGVLMLQGLAHVPQSRQAGASLVAQCTGIRLPVQGTRI